MRGDRPTYTTQSLLDVAVTVFTTRGYDRTSMEDLAKAAGLSKSSIYHHVQGKDQLLSLALDRALDGLFAVLSEPGATGGPAVDRLTYVIRRTTDVLIAELPYVTLLLRVRGNSATELAALKRRREFDQLVAELVHQAQRDSDVRADIDAATATRLIFGMINSLTEWYRPRDGSAEPAAAHAPQQATEHAAALAADVATDLAEEVVRLVMGGLTPRVARTPDPSG
jgi:AcrR family transcriptional regulator